MSGQLKLKDECHSLLSFKKWSKPMPFNLIHFKLIIVFHKSELLDRNDADDFVRSWIIHEPRENFERRKKKKTHNMNKTHLINYSAPRPSAFHIHKNGHVQQLQHPSLQSAGREKAYGYSGKWEGSEHPSPMEIQHAFFRSVITALQGKRSILRNLNAHGNIALNVWGLGMSEALDCISTHWSKSIWFMCIN